DKYLVRMVAAYKARSAWGPLRTLLRQANWAVALVATGLAMGAGTVAWLWIGPGEWGLLTTSWLALLLLPLTALARGRQAVLHGLDHVVLAQVPETVLQPFLLFVFVMAAVLVSSAALTATLAMGLNVLASGLALLAGGVLLTRQLSQMPEEELSA